MADNPKQLVNYNKLCYQLVAIGYIITALIILSHVIWYFAARSILAWPPEIYLRNYIVLPAIGLFALNFLVDHLVQSDKTTLEQKEYLSLLLFVVFSFYLSVTHDIAKVLLCSYILPIFASSIFSNALLSRRIFSLSMVGVLITCGNAYLTGNLDGDMIMEVFVASFMLVCTYSIARALVRFGQANLKKLEELNREAINNELAFYQAQINPHFLCNAINTIVSLCYTDGLKAAALLANLCNYLQFTFDFSHKLMMVSIEKEIRLVKAYVEIETARFGDKINVMYDIDPELSSMEVPSFCLEPLVENAAKHGLRKKENGGAIIVTVKMEEGVLTLMVSDTGVGMSKEKLDKLINCDSSEEGIGYFNVKRRMLGWKDTTFDIQSIEGVGTTVTMRVPGATA